MQKLTTAEYLSPSDEDEEYLRSLLHFPEMAEDFKGRARLAAAPALPVADSSKTTKSTDEPAADDGDDLKEKLEASIPRKPVKQKRVEEQVSARDFPDLYDGTGVNPDDLGCIMVDVEPFEVTANVPDEFASDLVDATTRHDHAMGAVGETEPHLTLLYGLLENGNLWKDKVDAVLDGWSLPNVTIDEVGIFETPDSYAVIAHVALTPELVDGHERLTLLPHIQTFSEYRPHITLAYIKKDADIEGWVKALGDVYNGKNVKTQGINYGDQPEGDKSKVDSSALITTAKQLHAAITEQLYGSPRAA